MPKITLNHYNLMTRKLDETVAFYTSVLGLKTGFYPVELGPGAWLYDSTDTPVVHTQEVIDENFAEVAAKTQARLGDLRKPFSIDDLWGSATVDHVAFQCEDIDAFRAHLQDLDVPFRESGVASAAVRQIFLCDPNGVILELNFRN